MSGAAVLNGVKKQFPKTFLENLNVSEFEVAALLALKFTEAEIITINELAFGKNLSFKKMVEKGFSVDRIKVIFYLLNEKEARMFFNDNLENIFLTILSASDICAICLDNFKVGTKVVRMKACGHMYHKECILEWFRKKYSCPTCNTDLKEDYPVSLKDWLEDNFCTAIVLKGMQKANQHVELVK